MIAPFRICRGAAAARVGAVDYVIVDQRGTVQQFDDGRKANGAAVFAARVTRGEKQERWTQALPSPAQQIRSDFRDSGEGGVALPREFFLDQKKVVADEIKNLFSREQRDGLSPA
jgi:predicted FMN-binding regulatory protein PaiB